MRKEDSRGTRRTVINQHLQSDVSLFPVFAESQKSPNECLEQDTSE